MPRSPTDWSEAQSPTSGRILPRRWPNEIQKRRDHHKPGVGSLRL